MQVCLELMDCLARLADLGIKVISVPREILDYQFRGLKVLMDVLAKTDFQEGRERLDSGDFLVFLETPPEGALGFLGQREVKEIPATQVLGGVTACLAFLE